MVRSLLQAMDPPTPSPDPSPANASPRVGAESSVPAAVPWQQVEQDELERWWDEVEARVFAGDLDAGPEPPWFPDETALAPPLEDVEGPDEMPDTDHTWVPLGLLGNGSVDTAAEAGSAGGWWAAADGAVEVAGRALREADQALGHAHLLVRTAARADAADEETWRGSAAGRVTAADDALAALAAASDEQRDRLAGLLSATSGGGLADRPRIALTDALTGALLSLTDLPGLRRAGSCGRPACRRRPESCGHDLTGRLGLGPPGPTDGYRPGADLDRWVRARDRRCRLPGCRRRVPRGGELDHDRPYPDGPTSAQNLAGYCTRHHRGKHQAPGWRHSLAADGTLTVVTPTGLVAVTEPPQY
jgi:hypothetical protein